MLKRSSGAALFVFLLSSSSLLGCNSESDGTLEARPGGDSSGIGGGSDATESEVVAAAGGSSDAGGSSEKGGMGGEGEPVGAGGSRAGGGSGGSGGSGSGGSGGSGSGGSGGSDDTVEPMGAGGTGEEESMPVIVASGANHARYLSIDNGLTWCMVSRGSESTGYDNPYLFRHVSFSGGRFMLGSWRAVESSVNGWLWTDVKGSDDEQPVMGQWIAQIQYGNGWWVATGGNGTAMRSQDLISWENMSSELEGSEASRALAFGNGVFITARDDVGWWSSEDGSQWELLDAGGGVTVHFDGSEFIPDPGYAAGEGIRLEISWPGTVRRMDETEGGGYDDVYVAPNDEAISDFAFGSGPVKDFGRAVIVEALGNSDLADCLGL